MPRVAPALVLLVAFAAPAQADFESLAASGSVAEVMDRLETAVQEAGATVFARVDHRAGAESVGMELGDAQVLIFGNPKLGTLPMQEDPRAGLILPLRMLVYGTEDGETRILWEEPEEMFDDLDVDDDADYLDSMEDALERFAKAASGLD